MVCNKILHIVINVVQKYLYDHIQMFFSFQTSEDPYNYLNVAPLLPSIISLTYAWNICKYLTIPCLRSEHFSWENRE